MSTEIEKTNLEAHVELCAERYSALEKNYIALYAKLDVLNSKVESLSSNIMSIKETLAGSGDKTSKQLIAIGTAIISVLITGLITMTIHLVSK